MTAERVLVVQCCHLGEFFYAAKKLRNRDPKRPLDAVLIDHPQVRFYLETFPYFRQIYYFRRNLPEIPIPYQQVVFPLLNRGYLRIKLAARWRFAASWEVDYEGRLRPLEGWRLYRSVLITLHSASPDFCRYLGEFPPWQLGGKILFLESCHPSLVLKTEKHWKRLIPENAQISQIKERGLWKTWLKTRGQDFGSAVVFFSGEKGFLALKLLPFLRRVPRILIVNERGNYFFANTRTMARFFYQRFRDGYSLPTLTSRVLLIQTEHNAQTLKAIRSLRHRKLAGPVPVWVFCREDKRSVFESTPGVAGVFTYSSGGLFENWKDLWRLARFQPNLLAAIFSGRPIFRWHKFLFFLLPAKNRLIFNENLDCFYWKLTNLHLLFHRSASYLLPFRVFLRTIAKIFLFLPRFFYLVIWITIIKLRSRYTLRQISPCKKARAGDIK